MLATIMSALTKGQAPGGGGGNPGADLSQQMAGMQGADPTMVLRQLEQVNQLLGVLFVKTFQSLPNVANNISATMKSLSRAIKEAQQGSNVQEVVGKSDVGSQPAPINFSAAQGGENSQAAAPGM